jgi:hypothetical protein
VEDSFTIHFTYTHNASYIHVEKHSRYKKSADSHQTTCHYIPEDKNSLFIYLFMVHLILSTVPTTKSKGMEEVVMA